MKSTFFFASAATLFAGMLTGCGGGGSSDASIPASNTYNVAAAAKNALTASRSFTVSGPGSDGFGYTAQIIYQTQPNAVFTVTGRSAAVIQQTLKLTRNSNPSTSSSSTSNLYYDPATGAPLGSLDDSGSCATTTSSVLPTSASVGAAGPLSIDTDLVSCALNAASNGTVTTSTWSLESASTSGGSFALLCENAVTPATNSSPSGKFSLCLEINADGSIGSRLRLGVQISNVPLFSLTATNY